MPEKPGDPPKFDLTAAFAGGAALVVAVLATVGVSGGTLTRAVRNQPIPMALVVVATLVVVAIPALVLLRGRRMFFYCLLALLVVLAATVGLGAVSVAQREQPLVALSATTAGDITTVVISASGSGLKSSQDMLVQVQAMSSFPDTMTKGLRVACGRDRFGPPHGSWPGSLLLWQQAGPDSSGAVSVRSTMEIPAGDYEGVCAFVALRKGGGIRFVQGFLRLKAAGT